MAAAVEYTLPYSLGTSGGGMTATNKPSLYQLVDEAPLEDGAAYYISGADLYAGTEPSPRKTDKSDSSDAKAMYYASDDAPTPAENGTEGNVYYAVDGNEMPEDTRSTKGNEGTMYYTQSTEDKGGDGKVYYAQGGGYGTPGDGYSAQGDGKIYYGNGDGAKGAYYASDVQKKGTNGTKGGDGRVCYVQDIGGITPQDKLTGRVYYDLSGSTVKPADKTGTVYYADGNTNQALGPEESVGGANFMYAGTNDLDNYQAYLADGGNLTSGKKGVKYDEVGSTTGASKRHYLDDLLNAESDSESIDLEDEIPLSTPTTNAPKEFFNSFYWNEKFQLLLERPCATLEESQQRTKEIKSLSKRFVEASQPIVAKIIEELDLPQEKKTIPPVDVGGIAGGDKFIHDRLFIKFAKDDETYHLYGGDEFAQKAAGHELKSLNALISCNIPNLHFPLMALVNYLGYRVIVISKLPINKETLRYGSADAGYTIHDDEEVGRLMQKAARQLNLKGHKVLERKSATLKQLYGPVDIEGHIGSDGRCYVVDTARLFPPATPNRAVKGSHLFRLIRPEFVKKNPFPLSSDAFTIWGAHNKKVNNGHVIQATSRLLVEDIPSFTLSAELQDFVKEALAAENSDSSLAAQQNARKEGGGVVIHSIKPLVHKYGINMRYLGVVLHHLANQPATSSLTPQNSQDYQKVIWTEMLARVARAILNQEFRDLPSPRSKSVYIEKVCDFLNRLFGNDASANKFWEGPLRAGLKRRFVFDPTASLRPAEPTADALPPTEQIKKFVSVPRLLRMFNHMCGIELGPDAISRANQSNSGVITFGVADVKNTGFTFKMISVIPFLNNLNAEGQFNEAEAFYREELRIKESRLGKFHPQIALTLANLAELYKDTGNPKKAERVFVRALTIMQKQFGEEHIEVANILERIAAFYSKYDKLDKSRSALEKALKIKTAEKNVGEGEKAATAELLASTYLKLGYLPEASKLYDEVIQVKRKLYGEDHWEFAHSENERNQLLMAQGDLDQAEELCKRVIAGVTKTRGTQHSELGVAYDNLGQVELKRKKLAEAESAFGRALEIKVAALGKTHSSVAVTLDHLAQVYVEQGRLEGAEQYYRRALDLFEKTLGKEHSEIALTLNNLGVMLALAKKYEEAETEFVNAHGIAEKRMAQDHPVRKSIEENVQKVKKILTEGEEPESPNEKLLQDVKPSDESPTVTEPAQVKGGGSQFAMASGAKGRRRARASPFGKIRALLGKFESNLPGRRRRAKASLPQKSDKQKLNKNVHALREENAHELPEKEESKGKEKKSKTEFEEIHSKKERKSKGDISSIKLDKKEKEETKGEDDEEAVDSSEEEEQSEASDESAFDEEKPAPEEERGSHRIASTPSTTLFTKLLHGQHVTAAKPTPPAQSISAQDASGRAMPSRESRKTSTATASTRAAPMAPIPSVESKPASPQLSKSSVSRRRSDSPADSKPTITTASKGSSSKLKRESRKKSHSPARELSKPSVKDSFGAPPPSQASAPPPLQSNSSSLSPGPISIGGHPPPPSWNTLSSPPSAGPTPSASMSMSSAYGAAPDFEEEMDMPIQGAETETKQRLAVQALDVDYLDDEPIVSKEEKGKEDGEEEQRKRRAEGLALDDDFDEVLAGETRKVEDDTWDLDADEDNEGAGDLAF